MKMALSHQKLSRSLLIRLRLDDSGLQNKDRMDKYKDSLENMFIMC